MRQREGIEQNGVEERANASARPGEKEQRREWGREKERENGGRLEEREEKLVGGGEFGVELSANEGTEAGGRG